MRARQELNSNKKIHNSNKKKSQKKYYMIRENEDAYLLLHFYKIVGFGLWQWNVMATVQ